MNSHQIIFLLIAFWLLLLFTLWLGKKNNDE